MRRPLWGVPAILLCLSVPFSGRVHALRTAAETDAVRGTERERFLLEASTIPLPTFGFGNFLADLTWLEAVQVAGNEAMTPRDYDRLSLLLQTTVRLDPRFYVPYILGAIVLMESPGHVDDALALLEEGRRNLPGQWLYPYYQGYIHYFLRDDPTRGGQALMEASRIPGCPGIVPLVGARMLSEGRRPETAIAFLRDILGRESDPVRRRTFENRYRDVLTERDLQMLEEAVATYRSRFLRAPGSLSDLVSAGIVAAIPPEPRGGSYFLAPGAEVKSDRFEKRLRVIRSPSRERG